MSKIQLPPKKSDHSQIEKISKVSEKTIQEIINKGGTPKTSETSAEDDRLKNMNIHILSVDLKLIGDLCNQRPKKIGKKIRFSKKDWLQEAIQEKIGRELKQYKLI